MQLSFLTQTLRTQVRVLIPVLIPVLSVSACFSPDNKTPMSGGSSGAAADPTDGESATSQTNVPKPATTVEPDPDPQTSSGGMPMGACELSHNQVCNEPGFEGGCDEGTDWFDCGYCPQSMWQDGNCDPSICPQWTDLADCGCPEKLIGDGFCDKIDFGIDGCRLGDDALDCGCPEKWANDGICDEPPKGMCALGDDPFDCGYCPMANAMDGVCNETGPMPLCPPGTDPVDCTCATPANDVCDEPEGTNTCPEGSDILDCPPM